MIEKFAVQQKHINSMDDTALPIRGGIRHVPARQPDQIDELKSIVP